LGRGCAIEQRADFLFERRAQQDLHLAGLRILRRGIDLERHADHQHDAAHVIQLALSEKFLDRAGDRALILRAADELFGGHAGHEQLVFRNAAALHVVFGQIDGAREARVGNDDNLARRQRVGRFALLLRAGAQACQRK
jgi:hypothetical protein